MGAGSETIGSNDIAEAVRILEDIYDVVRVVDPMQNTVVYVSNKADPVSMHRDTCYAFWEKEKFCDNCVSFRAVTERDTFVKFEVVDGLVYMITASPVEFQGACYAVEMFNDITNKGILENIAGKNSKDFTSIVLRFNDALMRDELTQLYNRRYINERLPVEIFRNLAEETPAALVIVDIDQFKKKNDKFGHVAGDMILQQFARLLVDNIPQGLNWAARYGGDEFLVYLHHVDGEQALESVERLRKRIEDTQFAIPDGVIGITCSLGICTLKKPMNMIEWIDHADKKLYAAKAGGGNKAVL
ncbi:hypothetical protein P22_2904 [Propionispora sp. 2/2-37]|uniref:GGDEF domain-containing protein n=1 Tax=Propionispora sp. 2/2-37 TaxID=1677858 RepID=UPI0006BB5636|nr:GGDEF domain-containing protein [Propionispora sp. 2/2-37]CUH96793.1 hypothetical protein P22_2904 [Propionispora sp. 2/2-37]